MSDIAPPAKPRREAHPRAVKLALYGPRPVGGSSPEDIEPLVHGLNFGGLDVVSVDRVGFDHSDDLISLDNAHLAECTGWARLRAPTVRNHCPVSQIVTLVRMAQAISVRLDDEALRALRELEATKARPAAKP